MKVRLPPNVLVIPVKAMFRVNRLPPELWDTWNVLVAIAWVTRGKATPPVSLRELAAVHMGTIQERALVERLHRLEKLGWLTVQRTSGSENMYYPVVPPDGPATIPERDSVTDPLGAAEISRRSASGTEQNTSVAEDGRAPSSAPDCIGGSPNIAAAAAVSAGGAFQKQLQALERHQALEKRQAFQEPPEPETATTTTANSEDTRIGPRRSPEEVRHICDALAELEIDDPNALEELLALPHVTVDLVENWVRYKRHNPNLGGGFFRLRLRAGKPSPYPNSWRLYARYAGEPEREQGEGTGETGDDGEPHGDLYMELPF